MFHLKLGEQGTAVNIIICTLNGILKNNKQTKTKRNAPTFSHMIENQLLTQEGLNSCTHLISNPVRFWKVT